MQYFAVWAVICMIITAIGLFIVNSVKTENTLKQKAIEAEQFHQTILNNIASKQKVLQSLQKATTIQKDLQIGDTLSQETVTQLLLTSKEIIDAAIVYIMDTSGTVIGCSPYQNGRSLLGKNYKFRPYFHKALEGTGILYPALGVTTNQKGLYYSTPIQSAQGEIRGVIVIKSHPDSLQKLLNKQRDPAFLSSPEGVVFITNRPEFEYSLVKKLNPSQIGRIEQSKQFHDRIISPSGILITDKAAIINQKQYSLYTQKITDDGWTITLCQDVKNLVPLSKYEKGMFRIAYILIILLATLLLVLHISMRQKYFAQKEFQAIFDSTYQSMVILSKEGTILKMNSAALSFKKRIHDDFTGSHFSQISWWDESSIQAEIIEQKIEAASQGKSTSFEATLLSSRGDNHTFDFSITPFYTSNMHVAMLIVEARDITHIRKINDRLSRMETYLRTVIDSMPSMVVCLNPSLHITEWNKETELITGILREKALNKTLFSLLPQLESKIPDLPQALTAHGVSHFHKVALPFATEEIIGNVTLYHLMSDIDEGIVLRIDNVTQNTKLEEQLQQSQKMEAIGQLTGGIAHDFNNLLTGIMGAVDLFQMDDIERPFLIQVINSAVKSGSDLTHKLLNFSRTENLTEKAFSIHEAISDALTILHATLDSQIEIVNHLKAENDTIHGSIGEFQNVIINLAINASHAISQKGTITIETNNLYLSQDECEKLSTELHKGTYLEVKVIDTGHGIDKQHIDKIFDPFFTTKSNGKGTGLGLATVLSIVKKHHGAIHLESAPGEGTCIYIYIPLEINPQADEEILAIEKNLQAEGTILLLEEDPLVRFTSGELLKAIGYTIILASSLEDALQSFTFKKDDIDIVILPENRALEGAPLLINKKNDIPILVTHMPNQEIDKEKYLRHSINGFLEKPFGLISLQNAINTILHIS